MVTPAAEAICYNHRLFDEWYLPHEELSDCGGRTTPNDGHREESAPDWGISVRIAHRWQRLGACVRSGIFPDLLGHSPRSSGTSGTTKMAGHRPKDRGAAHKIGRRRMVRYPSAERDRMRLRAEHSEMLGAPTQGPVEGPNADRRARWVPRGTDPRTAELSGAVLRTGRVNPA